MVSVMEYHCSAIKGLTRQERIEDEVRKNIYQLDMLMFNVQTMVAVNGCEIVHCDSLVKEAMGKYWSNSKRREDL